MADRPPVTLRTLRRMAAHAEPFACLTCYDATTARWLELGGIHVLLVGDTAAEIVLGHDSTIHMPLDFAIQLTAGVKRGAGTAMVMGDMPFMSYQASADEALRNAGRFLTEGLADVVKIEADTSFAPLVERMTHAGIPVCGHVGAKPQHVRKTSGYASAGRTPEAAERVIQDAIALEQAGAVLLLVEAVPPQVAEAIMAQTTAPLIGIGAGPACHGQILVLQDLLGMTQWQPGFASPLAQMGQDITEATRQWVQRVAGRRASDHRFEMKASSQQDPAPA